MEILLFDLDGVLLDSAGYHRSLVETVRRLSLVLGFGDRRLTQEEIDAFESRDITAEWDSSALCASLLLITAWQSGDDVSLPVRLPAGPPPPARHRFPDVLEFLDAFDGRTPNDPLIEGEALLLRRLGADRRERASIVKSVLRGARSLDASLTFRLVQLFNLGSRRFEEVYGEAAELESPSFLEVFDRPTLTAAERAALFAALGKSGRRSAIVTNRPSSSLESVLSTPEAEIGVQAAGFDAMPRVASGDLGWRAVAAGLDAQAFLKPSPVHLLAGIRCAVGDELDAAIDAAVRLGHQGDLDRSWTVLDGCRLILFEDAPKGHLSAREAVRRLQQNGISMDLVQCGIATSPAKTAALAAVGARVFPHVRLALDETIPGWRG